MFNRHCYLYVDDDALSREILHMIMQVVMGVECLQMFENSAAFAERLQALPSPPDVILMDLHIQPLNGFAMLEVIRSLPQFASARVIALPVFITNEEAAQLRAGGFDGVIAKPLSVTTFPTLIQRVLQGESVWHVA
ncbi:MAG: response regulator [Anaerolineae bacterium]|nr:response regulator [Anaerolineae bacterium]NUQ04535.1 response regulator [Anaerolineae bacterium]